MKIKCLILLSILCHCAFSQTALHLAWDKSPIQISLPLNQDRLIHFPKAISIVDSELSDVSVMKIQDALYLNAHFAFANKRLVVQMMPQGEAIVINLSANPESVDTTPIEIIINEASENPEVTEQSFEINPITLTRFAIQSLFSPERLLVTPPSVTRVPMQTSRYIHFMNSASVTARPLISWQANGLYVTAIELKNDLNKPVEINPTQFLGAWQTATLFPTNVLNKHDITTALITSSQPFNEALGMRQEFVR
ncbi:MAG: TIGR03749 family integrating conjugative element protein [Gammaproteobacteria bacterium]|jgi:integrating conjugative element protein (TIGR03749 family)|nr:TIGR03749 family integrating conjugative element protein [Gammaproteobacteria bacterium]